MKASLDLTKMAPFEGYSKEVMDRADTAVILGYVEVLDYGTDSAWPRAQVQSLSNDKVYEVTAVRGGDNDDEILGMRCGCPGGRMRARANCYHAAAFGLVLEKIFVHSHRLLGDPGEGDDE